jgi:hypothetical protein
MKKYIKQVGTPMKYVLIGGIIVLVLFTQSAFVSVFSGTTTAEAIIPLGRFRTTVATKISHESPYGSYGSYDLYQFYSGTKRYDYYGPNSTLVPKGEKYLLKYDTLYPEDHYPHRVLLREYPVFLPEECTNYTVGTLKKVFKGHTSFAYEYTILGKKYYRIQDLADNDPVRNHPQLVKGAEFLMEYLVANPKRAIIYIDKPKKDSLPFPVSPDIHVLRPVWDSIPVVLPDPEMVKYQIGW